MPKNCDTCKYDLFRLCGEEDKTPCDDCYNGNPPTKWEPGENYEPETNADRIRAMTDEELAKWMCGGANTSGGACYYCKNNKLGFCDGEPCHGKTDAQIILEWLQQPAEGD